MKSYKRFISEALIERIIEAGACTQAVAWLNKNKNRSREWLVANCKPDWGYWLRCKLQYLPAEVARAAEQIAIRESICAFLLRHNARNLPVKVARAAELAMIRDPIWARTLRSHYGEDVVRDVAAAKDIKE